MKKRLLSLNASAGTGKTFNLTARYISLLFQNANPSEILALTFTNKAAGEMHERIIDFFDKKPLELIDTISEFSGIKKEFIYKDFNKIKERFLSSDIYISTIDSFFNKILKKFCWYAGIEYDYEIGGLDEEYLKEEVAREILENKDFKKVLSQFLDYEKKNFDYFYNILNQLYNKDKEVKIKYNKASFPTTDKYFKILEQLSEISKYRKNSYEQSFENKNPEQLIKSNLLNEERLGEHYWFKKQIIPETLEKKFQKLKEVLKEYLIKKEKYYLNQLFTIYTIYKSNRVKFIKKENILDFKDIEHFVYDILKQDDFLNFFYFRLDSRIKHILIDEFQDTSITQFLIFKPLIDEITSEKEGSFFYVGDSKQAIYRFRGGQKELFDNVKSMYSKFGLKDENLNKNFRSRENIVNFVNQCFDFIDVTQTIGREEQKDSGYVEVLTIETESLKAGEKREQILKLLYEKVLFLLDNNVNENDITILTFTNDDIKAIDSFLSTQPRKIRTVQESALKLINQRSVRAVISFMKYLYYKSNLYLSEALALTGENPFKNVEIEQKDTVFATILNLMEVFSLTDVNTRLFLDKSIKFKDMEDFIENIDKMDIPAVSPGDGIRIMTIHKAKGLDFDNVIVVDRLGEDRAKKHKIIFDYDKIELKNIRFRINGLEKVDYEYRELIEREKILENEDFKNLLYVAFTRPKNSLIILQKEKGKIKELLNLENYQIGVILPSIKKSEPEIFKIDIFLPDIGMQGFEKEITYKPNDFQAIYNGLAIHHFFEFENRDFVMNKYGRFVNIDKIEKLFINAKNNRKYLEILSNDIYREFPVKFEDLKIIDLLVKHNGKFTIIDYKLTKPSDISNYIYQVKDYCRIIENIFKTEAESYLYFVDSTELFKVF
jgi:exodeoxyribonuclease V beta subunit